MTQSHQSNPAYEEPKMSDRILRFLKSPEGMDTLERMVREALAEIPEDVIRAMKPLPPKPEDMCTITFLDVRDYEEALRRHLRSCKGIEVLARGTSYSECELCFAHVASTSVCRDTGGEFDEPVHLCDTCIAEIWSRTGTPAPGANVDLLIVKKGGVSA